MSTQRYVLRRLVCTSAAQKRRSTPTYALISEAGLGPAAVKRRTLTARPLANAIAIPYAIMIRPAD